MIDWRIEEIWGLKRFEFLIELRHGAARLGDPNGLQELQVLLLQRQLGEPTEHIAETLEVTPDS